MEILTSKMQRVNARGCTDAAYIVNKPWYQYFHRQLDLIKEAYRSDDDTDEDLPNADDSKPPAVKKPDDDDHAPTGSAMSLLILPFNSFGQGGNNSPANYSSYGPTPTVLQSVPDAPSIAVTRNLPHSLLPIGRHGTSFSLKTCVDSCAGINLGDYDFHMAISRLYPETVAQFTNLTESGRDIQIGGVDSQGNGLKVTHVISYWMPFYYEGTQARVAFGLSDNVAATALVGIGFLRATNAIFHFTGDEPELNLQAIQLSLDVTFEPATVRPPPQRQDAFAVYQAAGANEPHSDGSDAEGLPALLSPFGLDSDSDDE